MAKPSCKEAAEDLKLWILTEESRNGLPVEDRFFPRPVLLQRLFPKAREILTCYKRGCPKCQSDYNFIASTRGTTLNPLDEIGRIFPGHDKGNDLSAGAVCLFALLVHLRHPLLIVPFLFREGKDSNVLESFAAGLFEWPKIREYFWPDYVDQRDPEDTRSKLVAEELRKDMSMFFRPVLSNERTVEWSSKFASPFFDQKLLGKGSFGTVFACRIFRGHNQVVVYVPRIYKVVSYKLTDQDAGF